MDGVRLTNIAAWVLVTCAILTTILVAKRELMQSTMPTVATHKEDWSAVYVDGWQDALTVGIRLGSANAPVQIVAFEDYQCPHCARFDNIVKRSRDTYSDQVAFTFVPFPLPYHDFAVAAQRIAECAHTQGSFEAMRAILFEKQQAFGSEPWTHFAIQANIEDISGFDKCVSAADPLPRIEQSKIVADRLGVRGTPTVLVNGWKLPVAPSMEVFDQIVGNVLEGKAPAANIDFLAAVSQN